MRKDEKTKKVEYVKGMNTEVVVYQISNCLDNDQSRAGCTLCIFSARKFKLHE